MRQEVRIGRQLELRELEKRGQGVAVWKLRTFLAQLWKRKQERKMAGRRAADGNLAEALLVTVVVVVI